MQRDIQTTRIGPAPHIAVDYAGSGELVLFIHGIGGNKSNWAGQLGVFSADYLAVAWDMRGYGESDDYDGPLDINDVCDDVNRVLDHFGATRAHIVGMSLGGMIAQEYYRRHANRVYTLTLANTNAGPAVGWTPGEREEFVTARTAPLMAGQSFRDTAPAVVETLVGNQVPEGVRAALTQSIVDLRGPSFIKALEALVQFDSTDVLPRIAVPTLLIGSREDQVTPLTDMREMAAIIPGARLVELDGRHLSNLEQPDDFDRVLRHFLTNSDVLQMEV